MRHPISKTTASIVVFMAIAGITLAHEGAKGVVKERMDQMGEIGQSMKVIGSMIRGQSGYDGAAASDAALVIADHAANIPALFPDGSLEKPSEALPGIWEEWEEFLAISRDLETRARKLSVLAVRVYSAKEIQVQFGQIGKTCSACHEKFRLKKP